MAQGYVYLVCLLFRITSIQGCLIIDKNNFGDDFRELFWESSANGNIIKTIIGLGYQKLIQFFKQTMVMQSQFEWFSSQKFKNIEVKPTLVI